ncbi:NYN domain-containing protein [Paenibacillus qinlingensis]|uniref:RNA-binding protein with PIN domain n=1 Tax=Paenibacillus qinlingensis TaxID=1837343 RepID=A0ABU1P6F5_9BACL|nr:NYN domain-containing protein [Paenibacillus qinlingensis]MDR6555331.1 putative RNA-binding protein with PIN domain [Paenibacillus qinlingensis]
MEQILIVDGYNIIGAWPELSKLKDTDLEGARDGLIHMLAEFQSFSGMKVYLVFDAYMVPGLGKKYVQNKLAVLYTKEKETADERIERLVTNLMGRRKEIFVATSDMIEQHVIFGKGALRMPAKELLVKIKQNRKEVRERIVPETTTKRNPFNGKLSDEMKAQFERMRRGE